MAITLPTVDDFRDFWGDQAEGIDDDRAAELIQLSGDLFWLATRLDTDPVDARLARLVKSAISDMAIYLYINRDDLEAGYSGFQSERIGSYSYSRAVSRARTAITANEPTGATVFDTVVYDLLDELAYGGGMVVGGQRVAREVYVPLFIEANYPEWILTRSPDYSEYRTW